MELYLLLISILKRVESGMPVSQDEITSILMSLEEVSCSEENCGMCLREGVERKALKNFSVCIGCIKDILNSFIHEKQINRL